VAFLLDRGFLAAGMIGIFGQNFERVQIDVSVRAIARAEPAADAPILDDDFERIAAANRAPTGQPTMQSGSRHWRQLVATRK